MIQPNTQQIRAFAHVAQNVPLIGEYLRTQRDTELNRLPITAPDSTAVSKGRCQVLMEIVDLLDKAPEIAAKPGTGS